MLVHSGVAAGFRLVTLNLNGVRSAACKSFLAWAEKRGAPIVCACEGVKVLVADVTGRLERIGALRGHFHYAQKKGGFGVGVYTRKKQREFILATSTSRISTTTSVLEGQLEELPLLA